MSPAQTAFTRMVCPALSSSEFTGVCSRHCRLGWRRLSSSRSDWTLASSAHLSPDHFQELLRIARAVKFDVEAELRGNHHLVADRLERFAHEVFVRVRPIHFGRIEERHARIDGRPDDRDAIVAARGASIALTDPHAPETERRHLEAALP